MYNYNSTHKVVLVIIVMAWAIFHFLSKEDQVLTHDNGNPIRTGTTENNLNEGNWTWYHKNGHKQLSGYFKKGKREGIWIVYDTFGAKILSSTYSNNLLNGEQTYYDKHGIIKQIIYYKNDKVIRTEKK